MRVFVALELPEEFEAETAAMARQLALAVSGRYMKRDTYHVTLAFIGQVGEPQIADIMDAMDEVCAAFEPLQVRPDGLGKFGRSTDATLWMGLKPTEEIMSLAQCLRERLVQKDIAFDTKTFLPHITLARRARIPKGALPYLDFPHQAQAAKVTLFKSTLTKEGAHYDPLYTYKLGLDES